MQNKEFPIRSFGPILVLCYTLLTAAVSFSLYIATGVKIAIVVIAAILFSAILGRSTPGHPPFGTEVDEEGIARPHATGKH